MPTSRPVVLAIALLLPIAACSVLDANQTIVCKTAAQCAGDRVCISGRCVVPDAVGVEDLPSPPDPHFSRFVSLRFVEPHSDHRCDADGDGVAGESDAALNGALLENALISRLLTVNDHLSESLDSGAIVRWFGLGPAWLPSRVEVVVFSGGGADSVATTRIGGASLRDGTLAAGPQDATIDIPIGGIHTFFASDGVRIRGTVGDGPSVTDGRICGSVSQQVFIAALIEGCSEPEVPQLCGIINKDLAKLIFTCDPCTFVLAFETEPLPPTD